MSKSKASQKLAQHLGELLTSVQNRAFWLSDQFRALADKVDVLAQKQRSDTAVLQQVQAFAKSETDKIAGAHNRLRFDFDQHVLRKEADPVEFTEFRQHIENLSQLHTTLRRDFETHRADANGLIDSAASAAGTVAGEKFMELTETLRAEVDRLRNLSASRTDAAIAKYNELYDKVQASLQRFNERISGLETVDAKYVAGVNRHNAILIESLQARVAKLEGTTVPRELVSIVADLTNRIHDLEQPREIRLQLIPVNQPPTQQEFKQPNVKLAPAAKAVELNGGGRPGTLIIGNTSVVPHS